MQVCTLLQTTTPSPHHSVITGRMPFLPPNQQRQSTGDNLLFNYYDATSIIPFNVDVRVLSLQTCLLVAAEKLVFLAGK